MSPFKKRNELRQWSQEWTSTLLKSLHDETENDDQVIDILLYMLEPDPEKRYSADECLARGCTNGLFRRTGNGHIVVATEATPEDDGARTPTLPPLQRSGSPISPSFQWTEAAASVRLSDSSQRTTLILPRSVGAFTPRASLAPVAGTTAPAS